MPDDANDAALPADAGRSLNPRARPHQLQSTNVQKEIVSGGAA
jgi:hypothetical protein